MAIEPAPALVEPGQPGWLVPARAAGLLLAAVVIGLGAMSVAAQFISLRKTDLHSYGAVQRLVVQADTGDVRVVFGPAGQSTVRTVIRSAFSTPTVTRNVTDGTLRLDQSCEGHWMPGDCSVDFEVTLPPGATADVTTSTGDVRVDGPTADVTVSADTGDVRVLRSGSQTIRARSSTGDVRLTFVTAPRVASAVTDTGDVQVQVPKDAVTYRVTGRSDTGDVRIDEVLRNGRSDRTIEAVTVTGDVTVVAR